MMGKGDALNEGLTEDDPDWVLPWAEEEDPSGEPGKTMWVGRRKADGEIIKKSEDKPDELLSKEELNKRRSQPRRTKRVGRRQGRRRWKCRSRRRSAREKRMRQRRRKK